MAALAEVPDPGDSLAGIAREFNRDFTDGEKAGQDELALKIRAGQGLLVARAIVPHGTWTAWVAENFVGSYEEARRCWRVAEMADELPQGITFTAAFDMTRGRLGPWRRYPQEIKDRAAHMYSSGMSFRAIGRELGVDHSRVSDWCVRQWREQRASELEREEREVAIKRAVKKAGAATQELYAMCERQQDVIAQAQREASTREAREALSVAGQHYRKMRDQVVIALGVE